MMAIRRNLQQLEFCLESVMVFIAICAQKEKTECYVQDHENRAKRRIEIGGA